MASASEIQNAKNNFKSINCESFVRALYASPLFTLPKTATDEIADQLADVMTAQLEKVAPLKHITRSSRGRKINALLSETSKLAKETDAAVNVVGRELAVKRIACMPSGMQNCQAADKRVSL